VELKRTKDGDKLKIVKPVRPTELRLYTAIAFTGSFAAIIATLAVFFAQSRASGEYQQYNTARMTDSD
jgi:hypothetical protein